MAWPVCRVVMPVRDCADYLGRSIPTIYAQGLADIEIVAVDDNSSDGSHILLENWRKRHRNFVLLQ